MADEGETLPLELLERGDPSFVDAIRQVRDADALAAFAPVWFDDVRPDSRRLLFEYLDRPLNASRHEGLIKRLFKKAEAADDEEVMARFLVLFDRSIRRVRRRRVSTKVEMVDSEARARERIEDWTKLGYDQLHTSKAFLQNKWFVSGMKEGEVLVRPNKAARLFSLATRDYLRRRAWRYFRTLGRKHPERYLAAVSKALRLYRDEDVADGLALIDNWGLIHILFHHCPALDPKPKGWTLRPGRSLAELAPSPIFEELWRDAPSLVVELLANARATTVRRWALRRVEADPEAYRSGLPIEAWLSLLNNEDSAVATLAARILEVIDGLETVSVDRWLDLVESTHALSIETVCRLIERYVKQDQVPLDRALGLACSPSFPLAELGFSWVKEKARDGFLMTGAIMVLIEARCLAIRPIILEWLHTTLASHPEFNLSAIVEFLDSRHPDARAVGWGWFRSDPRSFDDVETWRKLLESPHDDVRLALASELEARAGRGFEPGDLGGLWASVLLNIHRGSRVKPAVVRQIVRRLEAEPGEAVKLLPLLGVALRSVRGPERQAGLVAIVRLVETRAEVEPLVRSTFPELQWIGEGGP